MSDTAAKSSLLLDAPPTTPTAWRTIPFEVLRVLRAAAALEPPFSVATVATLLRCEPLDVLERLQHAADLGVALEPAGPDAYGLPPELRAALTATLLPALARAWQQRRDRPATSSVDPATTTDAPPPLTNASPSTSSVDPAATPADDSTAAPPPATSSVDPATPADPASTPADDSTAAPRPLTDTSSSTSSVDPATTDAPPPLTDTAPSTSSVDPATTDAPPPLTDTPSSTSPVDPPRPLSDTPVEQPATTSADPATTSVEPTQPSTTSADPATSSVDPTQPSTTSADPATSPDPAPTPPANPIEAAILAAAHRDPAHVPIAEPTMELESLDEELFILAVRPAASAPPPPPRPATRTRAAPQPPPRLEETAEDGDHLQLDFLAVAREAADRGEPDVAAETLRRALGRLGARPATPAHQRLRILGQIELARLQWQAAGPELGFTLNQALATLDSVRAEFGSDASSDLAAELCQVIAGICFDLGDVASLQRALAELAVARRLLQSDGESPRAARILNDQAAVLIRMGDAAHARDLLRESRTYFREREKDDPVAMRELAETDHLTAWLPLYATMVPGREQDGYRIALDRAAAAEQVYRKLDDVRELARVWETMGRLEMYMGQPDAAMQHLAAAADVQRRLGDLTGLARTTDAMSDLLRQQGRDVEAIALLRESVQYNRDKGSLIGLFHNRRAFTDLIVRLAGHPDHAVALQELSLMLGAAEREVEVGRARAAAGA